MQTFFGKVINIIFLLVFGFIIIGSLCIQNRVFLPSNQILIILSTLFFLCLFIFSYKKIINFPNFSKNHRFFILFVLFAIFFILQLVVARELMVFPSWDFGGIFNSAKHYALTSNFNLNGIYPNNYFLTYCFGIFYTLCSFIGYFDFLNVSIILNILLIDLSIFIVYLSVKKLADFNCALFATILCLFFSPFLFYTPIFYSDTLTMFIPILMFYITINIDENNTKLKNFLLLISLGLLAFVGYKIKASILVFGVAIFL